MSNLVIFDSSTQTDTEIIRSVKNGQVVVMFSAKWCPPCKKLYPIFEGLSQKHANIIFEKVDCDDFQMAASFFDISAMPTFMFFDNGNCTDTLIGATQLSLTNAINKLSVLADASRQN